MLSLRPQLLDEAGEVPVDDFWCQLASHRASGIIISIMALENLPLNVIGRCLKHRAVADTILAPRSQVFVGDFISLDSKHNVSVEELRVDGRRDEVKI